MARKKTVKPGTVLDVSRPRRSASRDSPPTIVNDHQKANATSISIDDSNTYYAATEIKDTSTPSVEIKVHKERRIEPLTAPLLPGTKPEVIQPITSSTSSDSLQFSKINLRDKTLNIPIAPSLAGSSTDAINKPAPVISFPKKIVINPVNLESEVEKEEHKEQELVEVETKEPNPVIESPNEDDSEIDDDFKLNLEEDEAYTQTKHESEPKKIAVQSPDSSSKVEPQEDTAQTEPIQDGLNEPLPNPLDKVKDKSEEPTLNEYNNSKPALNPEEQKAADKAAAEAKLTKLAESKQYYLPINAVEKKKSRQFVSAGILVALLLIVLGGDLALDLGTFNPNFNIPHTHFFNKTSSASVSQSQSTPPVALVASPLTSSEQTAKQDAEDVSVVLAKYNSLNNVYPTTLDSSLITKTNLSSSYDPSIFTPPVGTTFDYTVFPEGCTEAAETCVHYTLKVTGEHDQTIYLKHE